MVKQIQIIVAILVLKIWSLDLTTVAPNTFVQLSPVTVTMPEGYRGSFARRFWCNFSWDGDSQRVLFYEGYGSSQDHSQSGGSIYANALYSWTPARAEVKLLNLSTCWLNPSYDKYIYDSTKPPAPHPRHTYGGATYVSQYKSFFMGFGACAHDPSCTSADIWQYNLTTGSWSLIGKPLPVDNYLGESVYTAHMVNIPGSDTLWVFAPSKTASGWLGVYAFNLATHSWSSRLSTGYEVYNLGDAAVDTKRKNILLWASRSNSNAHLFLFDPATHLYRALDNKPDSLTGGNFRYIAKYDVFLFYSVSNKTVWTYAPSDSTWEQVQVANAPGTRIDDYFAYDSLNDIITMFDINGAYWVFRYKPSENVSSENKQTETNRLHLTLYPNPSKNRVEIRTGNRGASITVFDMMGKCVASGKGADWVLHASKMPAGNYMVKAKWRDQVESQVFTLMK